jgi:hypothetical protein
MNIGPLRRLNALSALSPRDRRAILIGLAISAPVLLYVGAVKPYFNTLNETRDRIAAERTLLERELELKGAKAQLPVALEAATKGLQRGEDHLVKAANPALAESRMTDLLEDLANMTRVLLQEVRSVPPQRGQTDPPGLQTLRLAIRGESDLEGVLRYMQHIEENPLLMHIRELSLDLAPPAPPQRAQRGRPARPPLNADAGVIQFTFVVEGFTPSATPAVAERK